MRWKFKGGTWIRTFPVVHEGRVFFGCYAGCYAARSDNYHNNYLYALDAASGDVLWRIEVPDISDGPHIAGSLIYIATMDGLLRAIDLRSGEELWTVGGDGLSPRSPVPSGGTLYTAGFYEDEASGPDCCMGVLLAYSAD